jgi:spermidine/putrescine transport system substrate-binding protein
MRNPNDLPAVQWPRPTGLSRRSVLRALGVGGAAAAAGPLLAACGSEGEKKSETANKSAPDRSDTDKTVIFENWPQYIDVDDSGKKHPTLDEFTAKTGIKVTYGEGINDNNEFFGRIRNQLANDQSIGRDIIVMTDWMAGKIINLGWVQELNKTNIPNAANLIPSLQNASFDPGRKYSLAWQSGFTAIGANAKALNKLGITDPSTLTVGQLLTDSKLKGKVTMLTEMQDSVGLVLLDSGVSSADFTDDQFNAAIKRIQDAVDAGQIRRFTGNDYTQDLQSGDVAACIAWSGDVIQLQFENDAIQYVTPAAGQMIWSDNMLIPNFAPHKKNAEILMNYYYDPVVAAKVAAWVNYICPVQGAKEAMADIDESLVDNPLIFPDEATLTKSFDFKPMDEATQQRYDEAFAAVTNA